MRFLYYATCAGLVAATHLQYHELEASARREIEFQKILEQPHPKIDVSVERERAILKLYVTSQPVAGEWKRRNNNRWFVRGRLKEQLEKAIKDDAPIETITELREKFEMADRDYVQVHEIFLAAVAERDGYDRELRIMAAERGRRTQNH